MALLPSYKDIVDLIKKGATIEAQEKIMELRTGALELQEENIALKAENKTLEERLEIKNHIEWDERVYWLWLEDDAGDYTIKDGPYCQLCYDRDAKLIRLNSYSVDNYDSDTDTVVGGIQMLKCLACGNSY